MWAVLFVWGGLELPRYALDNAEGPLRQLHAFLQERWPTYLRNHDSSGFREEGTEYGLIYPGPDHLPFGHHDIRVYIDNLFVEGKLTPVHLPSSAPVHAMRNYERASTSLSSRGKSAPITHTFATIG